ncbi:hypothetical protein AVEN_153429-1 [Araneus ventricosus]|uniref:Uncharacterized protein n=1 Tax=Araneus ventricosus TaxID=182803 RepID=A0A4Y2E8Z3_ARAVE|nr:hypothetical protein AVEN_153429-1 [Araneus ventricosus]
MQVVLVPSGSYALPPLLTIQNCEVRQKRVPLFNLVHTPSAFALNPKYHFRTVRPILMKLSTHAPQWLTENTVGGNQHQHDLPG